MWKSILSAAFLVLAVEAVLSLEAGRRHVALGETVGTPEKQVIMGTLQGPANEPWVFLYDVASQRLACYTIKNGVEIRGARECTYDFQLHDLVNLNPRSRLSPKDVKEMVK